MAQALLSPSLPFVSSQKLKGPEVSVSRSQVGVRVEARKRNVALPTKRVAQKAAQLAVVSAPLFAAGSAQAIELEDIQAAFIKAQEVSKQLADGATTAYGVGKEVFDQVVEVVKPAVDAATPVVISSAKSAFNAAGPVAEDLAKSGLQALKEAGVDTKPALDIAKSAAGLAGETAKSAFEVGTPLAQSTVEATLAQDPLILLIGGGALVALYYLSPLIGSSVGYSLRGYAGDVTAAQTLDLLASKDVTLIDLRAEKEKNKSGVPSLPRAAKNKYVPLPVEEITGKLRGQLRSVRDIEAEIAALKITALKRLNKSSNILLLDSYSEVAKSVARALNNLGFRTTFVVSGGFEGRGGWVDSRLQTESFNVSAFDILSPSRVISGGTRKLFGTSSSTEVVDIRAGTTRKLLPGSK